MKMNAIIELRIDESGKMIGYSIELPYTELSKLTNNDEEIIESIRDQFFWDKGYQYDGRESFEGGHQTRKIKFELKK